MTASTPPGALKQPARRQSEAKKRIVGPVPIAPATASSPADIMNGVGGKTATRSKAGCMTCRIRRKKCDLERVNDSCKTCIRLRIECLGWGAKRPEALRDPNVVKEIQHQIKIHLASNNMIKGSARTSIPNAPNTPSSAPPGGGADAGGQGASYAGGQSFLRFDNLRQNNYDSVRSYSSQRSQMPPTARKGKGRQAKSIQQDNSMEGDDIDGSGEEDYEDMGGMADEGPSSFSRHPPSYPPPNYDPYRRLPFPLEAPPQPGPYHGHPGHPYAQSSVRTGAYEYDSAERKMHLEESLREAEREREADMMHRGYIPGPPPPHPHGGMPSRMHPHYDPHAPPYPSYPALNFIHGPGVGAASAGRNYGQYGHAGYRGPSPSNSLNSSFPPPPPPALPLPHVKVDPYATPRLPPMEHRGGGMTPHTPVFPPTPSGSLSNARASNGQPVPEYLHPSETHTSPNGFTPSPYPSPNHYPAPAPVSAGPNPSTNQEDVDGEPMPQMNPNNPYLPSSSSFGQLYTFDKNFNDPDAEATASTALIPAAAVPPPGSSPPDESTLRSVLATLGMDTSAVSSFSNPLATLQQLQLTVTPPPMVPSAPLYVAQYGDYQMQFTHRQMELLQLYRKDLCNLQYHIAHSTDSTIADELFDLAMHSQTALFGTLTLTSLYKLRLRGMQEMLTVPEEEMAEVRAFKDSVALALQNKRPNPLSVDSGDAMAGLHMVSAVLFEGGTDAQWDTYLDVAKMWVANHPVVKTGSWNTSPTLDGSSSTSLVMNNRGAITGTIDKKTAFIIKTTAWFDVIGSITMRRAPFFLPTYRELFGRQGGAGMERIMGCNEKVLLAIAETAALAQWRYEHRGDLSVMELVHRAGKIEEHLKFVGPSYNGEGFDDSLSPPGSAIDDIDEVLGLYSAKMEREQSRHTIRLVSNVFRATGRLYLHSVVSGCNPDVQEIKLAVQETVDAFKSLQASAVDRSLVFPIALAGCMTDDPDHRKYLSQRLRALGKQGEAVGNTGSCLRLMNAVWKKRDTGNVRIVDWIDTMKEMGWSLLLV